MTTGLVDLTGAYIPPDRTKTAEGVDRIIAVPPVRDVPNTDAIEFILTGFANLAAGGAAFITLTDPQTGNPFAAAVPPLFRGVVTSILLYCPDMVPAAAPYLFAQVTLNNQLIPAWGFIPIYPRAGVAALSFTTKFDLAPNMPIGLAGKNTDAANTHFLGVYLYGWFWAKDLIQA
jgi:hypothetical protein